MFGIRRKDDVTAAAPVLKELAHLYEKEVPRVGVDFVFCAYEGETASLSAKAGNKSAFALGEVEAQPALSVPLTEEKIRRQLEKCGGTPFFANSIDVDIDQNISLPLSSINVLRREVFDKLYEELKQPYIHTFHSMNVENHVKKVKNPEFFARFSSFEQAKSIWGNVEKIILPLTEIAKTEPENASKAVAEIPRVFFGKEDTVLKKLNELKARGIETAACSTLDAVYIARQAGMKIMLSLGSNVFNSLSCEQAAQLGADEILLSPELTLIQASRINSNVKTGLAVYGRLPLMITRNCPIKNGTCLLYTSPSPRD